MSLIDLHLWEVLTTFAEAGTLAAAAQRLHVTEPSLSRALQRLEQQLGVALFDRSRNRIMLNATGQLAVQQAEVLLENAELLVQKVRQYDLSRRTIAVYSCAPGPLMLLQPLLTGLYGSSQLSSRIVNEEDLPAALRSHVCNLTVSRKLCREGDLFCRRCMSEQLYVSVSAGDPLAERETVAFADLDARQYLTLVSIGFWDGVIRTGMPQAQFYPQESLQALGELASSTGMPLFTTNISQAVLGSVDSGRTDIPVTDKEAAADYYLACLAEEKARFQGLFSLLADRAGDTEGRLPGSRGRQ